MDKLDKNLQMLYTVQCIVYLCCVKDFLKNTNFKKKVVVCVTSKDFKHVEIIP